MKALFSLKRAVIALVIASVLGLPATLEWTWQSPYGALAMVILNMPGMLLGLFHGRYFPPEGFIGQSPVHAAAMILAQALLWYLLISVLHLLRHRRATI